MTPRRGRRGGTFGGADQPRRIVAASTEPDGLQPVPGTDRRLTVGLVLLFAISTGTTFAVNATGSWWWVFTGLLMVVGTLFVVTALDAHERGWTLRHEVIALIHASRDRRS